MNKSEANELRNLKWWQEADAMAMLRIPVRTMEAPPKDLTAATEEAKLAVARYVVMHAADEAGWKLLIMMDRLLYAIPPKVDAKGESNSVQARKLVANRLRLFWSGHWQELAEDANTHCEAVLGSRQNTEDTPEGRKKLTERIEEMMLA